MNTVIIDGDVSYPPTSGKRLRTLNLMLRLARRHRVTYIGRATGGNENLAQAEEYLRAHDIEPVLVNDPIPQKKGVGFYGRLAANLLSPWPYSVTSHQSKAMTQAVGAYAANHRVDLWQFEWSAYLPTLEAAIPGARLLMAHNVDTLIWQRYFENARGFARRVFLKQQWRKFERFERWAFHNADRVVAVSPEDATLVRERFGQPHVDVVDNGIDRAYFESVVGKRDPRQVLFLGALDWRPNLDAVDLLLDKIFPQVLSQEPNARLALVGRNPPAGLVQRVASLPWARLHANVPDVRPFLAESGVMAVPLRIGGGSRLKILEALACGLPVVSSRVGAEGLALEPGLHYELAEEDTMAEALAVTMRSPATAQAQAQRGRALVLETYDWDVLAHKLANIWERASAARGLANLAPATP